MDSHPDGKQRHSGGNTGSDSDSFSSRALFSLIPWWAWLGIIVLSIISCITGIIALITNWILDDRIRDLHLQLCHLYLLTGHTYHSC